MILAIVRTRHCEIPAFAGMVYLGTGVYGRILPIFAHDTVRFLPSQEWSTGEQESISGFGIVVARHYIVARRRQIVAAIIAKSAAKNRIAKKSV